MPQIPGFFEDPNYRASQDFLAPYGRDILKGDIDPYYAPIGEHGGQELEDILGLLKRDVSRGVTEDMARRNVRSLRGTDVIARTMGDLSKKLRWDDYTRALKGRQYLFGQGRGITEGVRSAGLEYGRQKNVFNLKTYEMEQTEKAAKDKMWSDIISSSIGAIGTIYGGPIGGALSKNISSKVLGGAGGGDQYGGLDIGGDIYESFGKFSP